MHKLATFLRWAVRPGDDPINRWCSNIALAAVAALVVTVFAVEIAR